jgi:hypothetical protein
VIVAYSSSRLTRRPRELEGLIDLAEQQELAGVVARVRHCRRAARRHRGRGHERAAPPADGFTARPSAGHAGPLTGEDTSAGDAKPASASAHSSVRSMRPSPGRVTQF